MNRLIKVGHSPDADDAFMFYALSKGLVKMDGFEIEHVIEDIQSLNRRALKAELEVTAISAAVYPLIAEKYWILSCGASVGRNYGPILVAEKQFSIKDLTGKRIAIPGKQTTAFLLLKIFLDDFVPVEMNFQEVIPAVKEKRADAGLVIHEGQINFGSFGLYQCLDLGKLWQEKYSLPIPLGLDIARKDLGRETAQKFNQTLTESIRVAMKDEDGALDYALNFSRGLPKELARKFVRMYVNEDTLALGKDGEEALKILFKNAADKKILPAMGRLEILT